MLHPNANRSSGFGAVKYNDIFKKELFRKSDSMAPIFTGIFRIFFEVYIKPIFQSAIITKNKNALYEKWVNQPSGCRNGRNLKWAPFLSQSRFLDLLGTFWAMSYHLVNYLECLLGTECDFLGVCAPAHESYDVIQILHWMTCIIL
jgi:hypothetical protein